MAFYNQWLLPCTSSADLHRESHVSSPNLAPTPSQTDPPGLAAGIERVLRIPTDDLNARRSEGAFLTLRDGTLLFGYSHWNAGSYSDDGPGRLSCRYSFDHGRTWTVDDDLLLDCTENDRNLMEVNFCRISADEIALLYLRKHPPDSGERRQLLIRFSNNDTYSWSDPIAITDESGRTTINNDRLIQYQTQTGTQRLAIPVVQSGIRLYISDDLGRSWRRNSGGRVPFSGWRTTIQEPGAVFLGNGRLLLWVRSNSGSQLFSYSNDDGETFSTLQPSFLRSPLSPASIKQVPDTEHLLAVWNHNHCRYAANSEIEARGSGYRRPLSLAISEDGGTTWSYLKDLETNPNGNFCYTAIHFDHGHVLLAHSGGEGRPGSDGIATLQITRIPIDWLYT